MDATEPTVGRGSFQWNAGGWIGAQLGSTLWILISAGLFTFEEPALARTLLACFLVSNAIGLGLWSQRHRIAPYPAIQALVVVMGLAALAAIYSIDHAGRLLEFEPRLASRPRVLYAMLLLYPALMILFAFRERAGRSQPSQ
jgi:hypothetical protein